MTTRALLVLGAGQCVNWGVLYYAFAILLLPIEADLQVRRWVVTGAFSLGLLVSSVLAPSIGARIDQGHGPRVMRLGGMAAAVLLLVWALLPGVVTLYVAWAGLGVSMASTLYEPAFAVVSRTYDDPAARLRALAVITLCGGLASTVFLPLTGVLVATSGWRAAVVVLAGLVAVSTWVTDREVFRSESHDTAPVTGVPPTVAEGPAIVPVPLVGLLAVFGFAAFAAAAIIANLVPAMAERGISAPAAAVLGGAFGVMQLPGRVLMLHGRLGAAPWGLLAASLACRPSASACGRSHLRLASWWSASPCSPAARDWPRWCAPS